MSIVVPAHDEAALIERCLTAIVHGAETDELEVIVVANGCRDDTAARARRVPGPVKVVEMTEASKALALRRGDVEASGDLRFYVDADVHFDLASLREVAVRLRGDGAALAAAPALAVDVSRSPWIVRCYYRIWSQLPQVADSVLGRGVYALSAAGRARFDEFPLVMGDDEFVNGLFAHHERVVVGGAVSVIDAPRSSVDLLRRVIRSASSQRELRREYPSCASGNPRAWVAVAGSDRRNLAAMPAYVAVTVLAKIAARWRRVRGTEARWGRDHSTRSVAGEAAR